MKKIIILIIVIFCIGCSNEEIDNLKDALSNSLENAQQEIIYEDKNPITVGLYKNGKLVHDYNTKYVDGKDITFNIVYTNEENLPSTNIKKNWNKYYNKYENIEEYKIGFLLEFEANGKKLENIILDPSAKYVTSPYIYVYLYDGVHQKDGAHYTHLDMKDINDKTIYSSIKLFMCQQTKEISSPIKLTVFTYLNDFDFDINNHYRGNSQYTITIYNK